MLVARQSSLKQQTSPTSANLLNLFPSSPKTHIISANRFFSTNPTLAVRQPNYTYAMDYFNGLFNLTKEERRRMILRNPILHEAKITNNRKRVANEVILTLREKLVLSAIEVRGMVVDFPLLIRKDPKFVELSIDYLKSRLGMDNSEVKHIAKQLPSILSFSIRRLESKLFYLEESLGLSKLEIKKLVS